MGHPGFSIRAATTLKLLACLLPGKGLQPPKPSSFYSPARGHIRKPRVIYTKCGRFLHTFAINPQRHPVGPVISGLQRVDVRAGSSSTGVWSFLFKKSSCLVVVSFMCGLILLLCSGQIQTFCIHDSFGVHSSIHSGNLGTR